MLPCQSDRRYDLMFSNFQFSIFLLSTSRMSSHFANDWMSAQQNIHPNVYLKPYPIPLSQHPIQNLFSVFRGSQLFHPTTFQFAVAQYHEYRFALHLFHRTEYSRVIRVKFHVQTLSSHDPLKRHKTAHTNKSNIFFIIIPQSLCDKHNSHRLCKHKIWYTPSQKQIYIYE